MIDFLNTLHRNGQLGLAIDLWKYLRVANPPVAGIETHLDRVSALLNDHGNALNKKADFENALSCFHFALRASDTYKAVILNNAASCVKELGLLDDSIATYQQALALKPDFEAAHSGLLLSLHYKQGVTPQARASAHAIWNDRHGSARHKPLPLSANRDSNPDKVLRIGLISGDFGQHPVGIFLVSYLENSDQLRFHFKCYATNGRNDAITMRLRQAAASWENVQHLNASQLATKIQFDDIDILIDLSGHTAENRLAVFAQKPAPIQISWLGYPGDSGLSTMDYVIGDTSVLPAMMQPFTRAKILHLPHSFVCFDPPAAAPPVSGLPATAPGEVTFGCFHNPAKCGDEVIKLWADILVRLPQAKLLLKYKGFGIPSTQQRFKSSFAACGVDPSQLEFQGESPPPEMFAALSHLDIALDSFPFTGGLMTCLTLWMGVPVITLPGDSFASRQGLSFLSTIGITETIAASAQDYCDKAVALAHDLDRLADLRKRLRPAMQASPLCDGVRAAQDLQNLLRKIWGDRQKVA